MSRKASGRQVGSSLHHSLLRMQGRAVAAPKSSPWKKQASRRVHGIREQHRQTAPRHHTPERAPTRAASTCSLTPWSCAARSRLAKSPSPRPVPSGQGSAGALSLLPAARPGRPERPCAPWERYRRAGGRTGRGGRGAPRAPRPGGPAAPQPTAAHSPPKSAPPPRSALLSAPLPGTQRSPRSSPCCWAPPYWKGRGRGGDQSGGKGGAKRGRTCPAGGPELPGGAVGGRRRAAGRAGGPERRVCASAATSGPGRPAAPLQSPGRGGALQSGDIEGSSAGPGGGQRHVGPCRWVAVPARGAELRGGLRFAGAEGASVLPSGRGTRSAELGASEGSRARRGPAAREGRTDGAAVRDPASAEVRGLRADPQTGKERAACLVVADPPNTLNAAWFERALIPFSFPGERKFSFTEK